MAQTMELVRGATGSFGLTVKNKLTGETYTLAEGETLVFGMKRNPRDKECVVLKAITHFVDGEYILELTPADTVNLEYGLYHYDVSIQAGANTFHPVIELSDFMLKPNAAKCGDI